MVTVEGERGGGDGKSRSARGGSLLFILFCSSDCIHRRGNYSDLTGRLVRKSRTPFSVREPTNLPTCLPLRKATTVGREAILNLAASSKWASVSMVMTAQRQGRIGETNKGKVDISQRRTISAAEGLVGGNDALEDGREYFAGSCGCE